MSTTYCSTCNSLLLPGEMCRVCPSEVHPKDTGKQPGDFGFYSENKTLMKQHLRIRKQLSRDGALGTYAPIK